MSPKWTLRTTVLNPKFLMIVSAVGFFTLSLILIISQCSPKLSGVQYEDLKGLFLQQKRLIKRVDTLQSNIEEKLPVKKLPTIYAITPTYKRFTQKADLTRLLQTLMSVRNFHWIIVEDSETKTRLVTNLLKQKNVKYTHLCVKTQSKLERKENDPTWVKHRGVDQRNLGLKWIRENIEDHNGVIYFADDDNTYDLRLFNEMRETQRASVWPVALVGGLRWEGPICVYGKVIGFFTAWQPSREFPIDMAAFAIHIDVIMKHSHVYINADSRRGYLETDFLKALNLKKDDMEPKADSCRTILVWHTKTAMPNMKQEKRLYALGMGSDPSIEI
eukprot:gene17770-19546_t